MININNITRKQYDILPAIELFSDEKEYNRCYATVSIANVIYKFAWRSDLIQPVIRKIGQGEIAIGVDCSLCIIQPETGKISRWSLVTNITDMCTNGTWCVGICETSIIAIKISDKTKYKEYFFGELIVDFQLKGKGVVLLQMDDDSSETINLDDDNDLHIIKVNQCAPKSSL